MSGEPIYPFVIPAIRKRESMNNLLLPGSCQKIAEMTARNDGLSESAAVEVAMYLPDIIISRVRSPRLFSHVP